MKKKAKSSESPDYFVVFIFEDKLEPGIHVSVLSLATSLRQRNWAWWCRS